MLYVQCRFKKIMPLCFCILAILGVQAKSVFIDIRSFNSKFKENNVFIVNKGTKISGEEHLTILGRTSESTEVSKIYINKETILSGAENIYTEIIVVPANFEKKQSKLLFKRRAKKKVATIAFKGRKSHQSVTETICYRKEENHRIFILSKISRSLIANPENSFTTALSLYPQCPVTTFLINKATEKLRNSKKLCIPNSYSEVHITRPPPVT